MDANVVAQKNPAIGWDITVSVKAGSGEAISAVEVFVNGLSRWSENFNPPTSQLQKLLTQQGQYPGDNKAEVRVTDSKGRQTSTYNEWS
jgi:hypothetical protein